MELEYIITIIMKKDSSPPPQEKERKERKDGRENLQAGCCSSHFFFLRRHVMQPVLVRLLKTRLRLGATCTAVVGRSEEYAGDEEDCTVGAGVDRDAFTFR
jgi:hypothetical protein